MRGPALRTLRREALALRAEARVLTMAGLILLGIGFPLSLTLAALALWTKDVPVIAPLLFGGPPVLLGWAACGYASDRLVRAKAIEARLKVQLPRAMAPEAQAPSVAVK